MTNASATLFPAQGALLSPLIPRVATASPASAPEVHLEEIARAAYGWLMRIRRLLAPLALLALAITLGRADVTLVSEIVGPDTPNIIGNKEQADQPMSPASTFKMIIALTAFEQGLATPQTKIVCADGADTPGKPAVDLIFQQAMYRSSNDFFVTLLAGIKPAQLLDMTKRTSFGTPVGDGEMLPRQDWRHGGTVRSTPREEHMFMRKLMERTLTVDAKFQNFLIETMAWPSPSPAYKLYAKSGSFEDTYWMNGAAVFSDKVRIITVNLTAPASTRAKAIQKFYELASRYLPPKS